jgi:UDP-3-O-[3-hydroxymyristoyl] glucosamine N-acyltransferase
VAKRVKATTEMSNKHWTLGELAAVLGGELVGPSDLLITAPAQAGSSNPNGLAFAESEKYVQQAEKSLVGAVIIPMNMPAIEKPHIKHPSPRKAFGHLLHLFDTLLSLDEGIHPSAVVDPTAVVADGATVGAFVYIGSGSTVEAGAKIYPFAYIGDSCSVGVGSVMLPHAVLIKNVRIGENCTVGPGAVVGHSGFGYYFDGNKQVPIPQVGGVAFGDGVDIGALTAIDRATADETILGDYVKIDNLVQVGHNVRIGKNTILTSQVGVAGSTQLGERVVAGGQSGFSDHIEIADGVMIGGGSAVLSSIREEGIYTGYPAMPMNQFRRSAVIQRDLPDLARRVKALEKRLAELESGT